MRGVVFQIVLLLVAGLGAAAQAEPCGGAYTVQPGETLSTIAERHYGDASLWARIQSDNRDVIGDAPDAVRAGMTLWLPCVDGRPTDLKSTETAARPAAARGALNVLTASGYAPFADRDMPEGGIFPALVEAALAETGQDGGYKIHWIEDRNAHLDPLLSNVLMDMGFPWPRPDCDAAGQRPECRLLLFSDPVFEVLSVLFVAADREIAFERPDDLAGLTLCRPSGFLVHDLDRPGQRLIGEGAVTLVQPPSAADCLAQVMEGKADAMAMDEFSGQATVRRAGLSGRIKALADRPLSIETLHVVVPRAHPRAAELIGRINAGLREIRENGRFQSILDTHLTRYWEGL